jgi:hypothetical protein
MLSLFGWLGVYYYNNEESRDEERFIKAATHLLQGLYCIGFVRVTGWSSRRHSWTLYIFPCMRK